MYTELRYRLRKLVQDIPDRDNTSLTLRTKPEVQNSYKSKSLELGNGCTLIYLQVAEAVTLRSGPLPGFFHLQFPVIGETAVLIDSVKINCNPTQGMMSSPHIELQINFAANSEHLIIHIEKRCLERHLEQLIGRRPDQSLKFMPVFSLTESRTQELTDLMSLMISSLVNGTGLAHSQVTRTQMDSLFLSCLLTCLEHNFSNELLKSHNTVRPIYITKAQNFIHSNVTNNISPEDIATAANISTRTLFMGFQEYLNTTPMRYLKDLRLEQVRQSLDYAHPIGSSVTTIAMEYGFNHLGHFCTSYKEKFGELPHETLNRTSLSMQ